jgi:hypothetical protein
LARRAGTHSQATGSARRVPSLFGLAPCGVYPASPLYSGSGALLPHLFTLTSLPLGGEAVSSLWHLPSLSLDAQIPDVIRHTALRSSDFPPPRNVQSTRAAAAVQPTCSSILSAHPRNGPCDPLPCHPERSAAESKDLLFSRRPVWNCHPDRTEVEGSAFRSRNLALPRGAKSIPRL